MKRPTIFARLLRGSVPIAAAVVLLTSPVARAQFAAPFGGFGTPFAVPPGTSLPVGRAGTPFGLGPAPLAPLPGASATSPGLAGSTGLGTGVPFNNSFGPPLPPPGYPALAPSTAVPGLVSPGLGGMQP
jgi:hypothetical protein